MLPLLTCNAAGAEREVLQRRLQELEESLGALERQQCSCAARAGRSRAQRQAIDTSMQIVEASRADLMAEREKLLALLYFQERGDRSDQPEG